MAQKLMIEVTDAQGGKSQKQVTVIRSWQDASGHAVFLFGNGSYGYKNGEPIKDQAEFGIIGSPIQHKAAMAWWKRAGRELSARYYESKAKHEARLMGDFSEQPAGGDSRLDEVLYFRASVDSMEELEGPFAWMDLFGKRPDWWGQARQIVFADYGYIQESAVEPDALPAGAMQGTPAMDPGLPDGGPPQGTELTNAASPPDHDYPVDADPDIPVRTESKEKRKKS